MALPMGPPGRDLQDLEPGAGKRRDQAAPIAARALNADHRVSGLVIDQPFDQPAPALRVVRKRQRPDLAATLIDQRSRVRVLVNVDSDNQGGLLARG